MKRRFLSLFVVALMGVTALFAQAKSYGHGLQEYKLSNGLTVYLWEDHTVPDVHGRVVIRAGAVDEPAEYTGLAHYLEHMMFKGTQTIGCLDWAKEKPIYDSIIDAYSRLNAWGKAHANDKEKKGKENPERLAIIKEINELSLRAAQYGATNDFSNLTESYGGDNLNAFTSYDLTAYHNDFPASAMEKWMALNSERLINPVFRSFQAELENVFEEYNMYNDDYGTHQREFLYKTLYGGTPYERDVIGYANHLKNPSLQALIDFYNTWYVPNNMCLLLVGDFNAEQAKPLIEKYFGKLVQKNLPDRPTYPAHDFSKDKKTYKLSVGYTPQYIWGYQGIKEGDKDATALEFAFNLLNNNHETGLLDKLNLNGEVGGAYVSSDSRRIDGRILVIGVPYYDMAQRTFDDIKTTEKLIYKEIEKIKNANTIPDWLFNSVKDQMLQGYRAMMDESQGSKINICTYAFTYQIPLSDYINEEAEIKALTKEQVAAVAAKYLNGPRCTIDFEPGEPKKNKLAKPAIKPLDPPKGVTTEYAKEFKKIPTTKVPVVYNNFADATDKRLFPNVDLHYSVNDKNDLFSLTLRYGVGTHQLPKLQYAVQLMNTAGCLQLNGKKASSTDVHRAYSELGATYSFDIDDSYFYISVYGDEKNLDKIVKMLVPQIMMPDLDDKQIKSMISNAYWSRYYEKKNTGTLSSALWEWVLYGDNSRFIDRIPMNELYHYSILPDGSGYDETFLVNKDNLTTTIQEATGYKLDIYYCGKKDINDVAKVMEAVPMQEKMRDTQSPYFRTRQTYANTQIMFLPDSKMQQAKVYFYVNGTNYNNAQEVYADAFNQYFSGGFSGLVMNEIREKRSMAYTAYGAYVTPSRPNLDAYLIGYVGTQSDKVADAVDVMMDLITNMPAPEDEASRMADIKEFLYQSTLVQKPSMRGKCQTFEYWRNMGYNDDPAKVNIPKIENLTFEQIKKYYEDNIKGRPITIVIIGDPKMIDQDRLEAKYGKMNRVSNTKLFKGGTDDL